MDIRAIRAYTCIYVHTFIYGYTYIYVHIHAYTYIRSYTQIRAYTCIYIQYMHIHAYTCIHAYTYIDLGRHYTCIYVHIHAYTYIYEHIHTDTCIYVHIRLYTYIFNHHQIVVGRCFGGEAADVFWQQYEISPTRSAVMGHETGSQCSDMARGTAQHGRGGCKRGPGRVRRGGGRKIGCAKVSPTTKKNACPDALGCPEWGPLAAVHRECVLGKWHQLPCFRGS